MRIRTFLKATIMTCLVMLTVSVGVPCYAAESQGINVNYHSQKDIQEYLTTQKVKPDAPTRYKVTPSLKSPYSAGALNDTDLRIALRTLNAVRYIAGIDADVKLDASYNDQTQAAALINAVNGGLSHFPTRPSGMSDELYEMAAAGSGSSNIAYTSWDTNLGYAILHLWMFDGDFGNVDRVGHRRWILNPAMKKTGFGLVQNGEATYTAMYTFDNCFGESDYYGVAWPAQNMPVEYFGNIYPWSISMGEPVDISKVKVTLTRKNDNKKWTFSQNSTSGFFNVENSNYGQTGCIIFRPDGVIYKPGDKFSVQITGLTKKVAYDVNFFSVDAASKVPETSCTHTYGTAKVTKKATLKADGEKTSVCTKCQKKKTTIIPKIKKVALTKSKVTYNGKTQKPKVTVKDANGKTVSSKYYTVTYKGTPKNPGSYLVTVKFKTNYSGTKKLYYQIKPKVTGIRKVTPLKKAMQVVVKKGTGVSGYEVCYSTDAAFKKGKNTHTLTLKGVNAVKKTVKQLERGKRYYVRVRTYKTAKENGKTVKLVSNWSTTRKVTIR